MAKGGSVIAHMPRRDLKANGSDIQAATRTSPLVNPQCPDPRLGSSAMPDVLIIGLAVYLGLALLAALVIFPALIAASRADELTNAVLSGSSGDMSTSVRDFAGLGVRSLSAGSS